MLHRVTIVHELTERAIVLKILNEQGAAIGASTASGKPAFGIFAVLAELGRELTSESTLAGWPPRAPWTERRTAVQMTPGEAPIRSGPRGSA